MQEARLHASADVGRTHPRHRCLDQYDALQHPTIDHWYNLAQLRGQPAFLWQAYKARLYVEDIYDGKDVPVSKDDYARAIIAEGQRRGITARGIVIALATTLVESNLTMYANAKVPESMSLPHEAVGSDGLSVGLFQQQVRDDGNGWWWGDARTCMDPTLSAGLFYDRLAKLDYNGPNSPGSYAQDVQDSAYPDRYDERMGDAQAIYDRLVTGGPAVTWTGDPVWLEDVLRARPLLKDKVRTFPGWQDRGHGDFGSIWGIVWHHTGNAAEKPDTIANHPTLGLAANIHIAPDGIVTITGVGVAWHAGEGIGFGLPEDGANQHTIGIECAWPHDASITPATQGRERWPDAQIIAMREVGAALSLKLGVDSSHNIGHKEWAGADNPLHINKQGKWDPGNLDMNWFRGEIAKSMRGEFGNQPAPQPGGPPVPAKQFPKDYSDRELLEWIVAQLGAGDPSWASKGMTLRDKVWSLVKGTA